MNSISSYYILKLFFVVNITIPEGNLTPHYKEMLNFYKELKNIKQWEILYKISPQKKINQHFIFSKLVLENVLIYTLYESNNNNYKMIRERDKTKANYRETLPRLSRI